MAYFHDDRSASPVPRGMHAASITSCLSVSTTAHASNLRILRPRCRQTSYAVSPDRMKQGSAPPGRSHVLALGRPSRILARRLGSGSPCRRHLVLPFSSRTLKVPKHIPPNTRTLSTGQSLMFCLTATIRDEGCSHDRDKYAAGALDVVLVTLSPAHICIPAVLTTRARQYLYSLAGCQSPRSHNVSVEPPLHPGQS